MKKIFLNKFIGKLYALVAGAALFLIGSGFVQAQTTTFYWYGTSSTTVSGNFNTAADWSTDASTYTAASAVPTASTDLFFNMTSLNTSASTVTLSANAYANSLTFNSTGNTTLQSNGSTGRALYVGSGGVTANAGSGVVTIGSSGASVNVDITASQAWINNSSNLMTFRNGVTGVGNGAITLTLSANGAGMQLWAINDAANSTTSVVVKGSNTVTFGKGAYSYGGDTSVLSGTLSANVLNGELGAGTIYLGDTSGSSAATLGLSSSTITTITNSIVVQAGTTGTLTFINNGTTTFSGSLTLNNALTYVTTGSGAITTTQSGVVSGAGTLTKTGSGTLYLTNASNSFSGELAIKTGTVVASSLNATGTGTQGAIDLGNTTTTTTFSYIGSGETVNRTVNLAGTTGGGVLDSSGTGALIITGGVTPTGAGAKTLTLSGTNTNFNTIQGAISNYSTASKTAVIKSGTGTWVLGGANTYTGGTTVSAGVLVASNSSAFGTGKVTVASGATVSLYGSSIGTVSTGSAFTISSGGTIELTLAIDGTSDVLSGSGLLTLTGGTISLNGTINYNDTYDLFDGFSSLTGYDTVSITGFSSAYTASLSSDGILSFTSVPEPTSVALLILGGLGCFGMIRLGNKRRRTAVDC